MKPFCFIFPLVFISAGEIQKQKLSYEDDLITSRYEISQGRMDGPYVSFYKNGQKKAEGKFENNCRSGMWTVWDSSGKIAVQRKYDDIFLYKTIVPAETAENNNSIADMLNQSMKKNQLGYLEYFHITESMVIRMKRIWRTILPQDNQTLFENNLLFAKLNALIFSKDIKAYDPINDEFTTELTFFIDTSSVQLLGFKIKEDWFVDNQRWLSDVRIIDLCPFGINKESGDTVDFYHVYFPETRKYFAGEILNRGDFPAKVQNLDDLFFYRCFSSKIYKESNIYDRDIKSYKRGEEISREAQRIEISLIENEHDIWIQHFKQ